MLSCIGMQHALFLNQIMQAQEWYKLAILLVMLDRQHMTGITLRPECQKHF